MLIDISLLEKDNQVKKLDVNEKKLVQVSDYDALVSLIGTVKSADGMFVFDGYIEGEARLYCSSCLKELSIPYKRHITQFFSRGADNSISCPPEADMDDILLSDILLCDILLFEGSKADFEPVVAGIIRGDMPIAVKCGDSCKGLCPVCGIDLNVSVCNCADNYRNPVFDKLKGIVFTQDSEF